MAAQLSDVIRMINFIVNPLKFLPAIFESLK